ncbi:uncharacterized protein LOC142765357 [Rhipicephalus microplus]|uniref:uncharacterized protein LOC142765357 n=1 Tax=Rhipicephalus microplus TaxID=6941 RepID=UPI003F6B34C1
MYPPDGLCNYLFYTHVIVFNKTELAGVEVNASWTLFKKQIAARTKTAGGASFDAKYVTAQAFDDQGLKKHLAKLASANVKNYGILNMVTSVKNWDDFMNRARGTIAKLKAIQGNDSKRKIVMAIGLFDYNEPNAWDKYRKGFQDAVESTMADTVIAISSMSMMETSETCYAAPTSVLDSSRLQDPARTIAKSYPDLKTHAALISANTMYNKNGTRLGLSFEMGTLYYKLNETTDSLENRPYHPCERFYLTSIDVVDCIGGLYDIDLLPGGMKFGSPFVGPDVVVTWEDEESLKYKFYGLQNSTNLREGLSWLLYDVNFGDFSKNCNDNPFTPIEIMKKFASRR